MKGNVIALLSLATASVVTVLCVAGLKHDP